MAVTLTDFEGSLFDQFRRLEEEMEELFSGWPGLVGIRSAVPGGFPPVNIGITDDRLEVYVFAPGINPKSIDVSLRENVLTISGERQTQDHGTTSYYRKERFSGSFRRVITLPDDVVADRAEAKYRDGVLQITVPRKEAVKPRLIEVKAA